MQINCYFSKMHHGEVIERCGSTPYVEITPLFKNFHFNLKSSVATIVMGIG